ncbi:MAG: hypothetical protein MI865_10360, partial [Proteobacteria bacterium]|nr:hypothetical protein [Pseudomonadota bacterium]
FFLFKKLDVIKRLHVSYSSTILFLTGSFIVIIYLIIRVFASSIQGGGPAYVVSIYGIYPLLFAKICLYIGVVRLLIGIEPKIKIINTVEELEIGRQLASKYLNNPILFEEYVEKSGTNINDIKKMVSTGELKAYEYKKYMFVEEKI